MYPNAPTWQSSNALSAWWRADTQQNGSVSICGTQGKTFVKMLQEAINNLVGGGIWNNPWAVLDAHTGAIGVDGNWGPITQQGLGKLARAKGIAPGSALDQALQADLAARTIGLQSLLAAIWLSQHQDLDISKVNLSSNAQPPIFGSAPPDDGSYTGAVTCWTEGQTVPAPMNNQTGQPIVGGTTGINQNPISRPGILGSSAGGQSTGVLFLLGATLFTAVGVALLSSKSRTITRYRRKRK